jgi:hypothetical protein
VARTLLVGLKGRERKTGAMGKEVLGSELEADKKIETVRGPSSRFPELRTPTFGLQPSDRDGPNMCVSFSRQSIFSACTSLCYLEPTFHSVCSLSGSSGLSGWSGLSGLFCLAGSSGSSGLFLQPNKRDKPNRPNKPE